MCLVLGLFVNMYMDSNQKLNDNTEYLIEDQLFEYAKLLPSQTGLKTIVYVDDGGAYIRNQHPLVILFRNGYSESAELMAILVSKSPTLYSSSGILGISTVDYSDILSFVSLNADLLQDFADEKVNHEYFYDALQNK